MACRLNLFVSLAACHGERLATGISPTDAAPVWGLLGPRTAMPAGDLLDRFSRFFVNLLASSDLDKALLAAGGGLPGADRALVLWPADYFFAFAFRGYLNMHASSREIARRAKGLAAEIQKKTGRPADDWRSRATSAGASATPLPTSTVSWTFLMLDRFPENEARFGLSWRQFQATSEKPGEK